MQRCDLCPYVRAAGSRQERAQGRVPSQQPWSETSITTRAQAAQYREQLMQEREFFVGAHNGRLYGRGFSLCEHRCRTGARRFGGTDSAGAAS